MAGIAGFLDLGRRRGPGDLEAVAGAMADRLAHRGPDGKGAFTLPECGLALAARRMAVQDPGPGGAQPMTSADGRFTLILDGEIFNFQELRRALDESGCAPDWRGRSDTEVLLAAIAAWGVEDALRRCDGMFALALWDLGERRLVLARDRMGEKPLYCGWSGRIFLFGSELKAIAEHPDFEPQIDPQAVSGLMRYGYVPSPVSIYCGIGKLTPGMLCGVSAETGEVRESVYWDPVAEAEGAPAFEGGEDAAVRELERLIARAVSRRMVGDLPVGAFLSGGVDSAVVAALMQAGATRPAQTFTIGFSDPRYDEAPHARAIATHLGTDHSAVTVDPAETIPLVEQMPFVFDEPFADISQLPALLLAHLTRREVGAVLTGDGGAALFGGHPRYRRVMADWRDMRPLSAHLVSAIPYGPLNLIATGVGRPGRFGDKLYRTLSDRAQPSIERLYEGRMARWRIVDRPCPEPAIGYFREGARRPFVEDDLLRLSFCDAQTALPDDLLVKADRAGMAASLEMRAPLLNHDIVRFAWGLPAHLKLRDGKGNHILRAVLDRHVPRELTEGPKHGFAPPLADWLRGPLRDWAQSLIASDRLEADGVLDPEPVRAVWEEHLKRQRNWHVELWTVLMLQSWREAWNV
jgi:asparagine synthase (glutamine-hydrolysing)